jgi:putative oxidoreductase
MTSLEGVDIVNLGLLLVRIAFGTLMAAHGAQKLFGWFGGYGLNGTGQFFEGLGFRPGRTFAFAAGASESIGGLLVVLGLLHPVGAALIVSVMLVATATVHWGHGLFAGTNGIEIPVLYGTAAVALALTGPGVYSLDHALGLAAFWTPAVSWSVLGAAILGGAANLGLRRQQPVSA